MEYAKTILVTGGAGFISVLMSFGIVNCDELTYAGNLKNLTDVENASNYVFVKRHLRLPKIKSCF